jgi:small conductance mechanosensitive channel
MIVGQLQSMAESFVTTLPSLVIALIVLIITWLIDTLVKLAIWLVGLTLAMIIMLPGFTPTSLIAGLGIGAVAIGFAFQDIFENFLAGVLIMLREKMRIGDII